MGARAFHIAAALIRPTIARTSCHTGKRRNKEPLELRAHRSCLTDPFPPLFRESASELMITKMLMNPRHCEAGTSGRERIFRNDWPLIHEVLKLNQIGNLVHRGQALKGGFAMHLVRSRQMAGTLHGSVVLLLEHRKGKMSGDALLVRPPIVLESWWGEPPLKLTGLSANLSPGLRYTASRQGKKIKVDSEIDAETPAILALLQCNGVYHVADVPLETFPIPFEPGAQ